MKNTKSVGLVGVTMALVLSATTQAGELIYQPLNPSFGGDPFVGSYLLGKAQSQDTNTDPNISSSQRLSETDRLIQRLESRLISQVISDVSTGDIQEGSFDSDEFGVVVSGNSGELVVRIVDKLTGDITEVSVGGLFNP